MTFPPEPFRETAAERGSGRDLGQLPEWDLSDLYPSMESPELEADLARMTTACRDFAGSYEGKLATLDGEGLARAIAEYEPELKPMP